MIGLRLARPEELDTALDIIDGAKRHLREQGIDQWQQGYPDRACLREDLAAGRGYFAVEGDNLLGYLCVDYGGEPAYGTLQGKWATPEKYVVVHRMAFTAAARGKGASGAVFRLVEEMSREKGIHAFRVDTDQDNHKMRHILEKNGFTFRGVIRFDNSDKIAFDKTF